MAKKQVAQPLTHGALVSLPGGRVGEWKCEPVEPFKVGGDGFLPLWNQGGNNHSSWHQQH